MADSDKIALIQAHTEYVKENVIAALLHFHQLKSQLRDDLIVIEESPLRIDARLADFNHHHTGYYVCQLDFLVWYDSKSSDPIGISVSGNGLSLDEAINQGIDQWVVGTIPALVASFGVKSSSINAATIDYLTGDKQNGQIFSPRQWKISFGPIMITTMTQGGNRPANIDALREALKDDTALFAASMDAMNILLQRIPDRLEVLSVKVYVMRLDDGIVKGEFRMNSTLIPELVDLLGSRIQWINTKDTLQIIRQFMIIQRVGEIDPKLMQRLSDV